MCEPTDVSCFHATAGVTHDNVEEHMNCRHASSGSTMGMEARPADAAFVARAAPCHACPLPCMPPAVHAISLYGTLDKLFRGDLPYDLPPLEVVRTDRKLWCLRNRRLTVLKWLQATRQDDIVWAKCVMCFPHKHFRGKKTSDCDGLGIRPRGDRHGTPMHLGANTFSKAFGPVIGSATMTCARRAPSSGWRTAPRRWP